MTYEINVLDYGADPNMVYDSTIAFQNAANAAAFHNVYVNGQVAAQTSPRIVIPSGRYLVSGPIQFMPICNILGHRAVIHQTNPAATPATFVFNGGTTVNIQGVSFVEGIGGLYFTNPNIDGSVFNVDDCRFDNMIGTAIVAIGSGPTNMSAKLNVSRCRWRACRSALSTWCDMTSIEHSWVTAYQAIAGNYPVFNNARGRMTMYNNMLVPADFTQFPIQSRWIDNAGSFFAKQTRFSGENGGIPIMDYNGVVDTTYPYMGDTVEFEGCQLSAGPSADSMSCILNIESGCPNVIRISSCDFMVEVPIITGGSTLSTCIAQTKIPPYVYINGNQTWGSPSVPSALLSYMR